jgi:putative heme-binding domain-containing protein
VNRPSFTSWGGSSVLLLASWAVLSHCTVAWSQSPGADHSPTEANAINLEALSRLKEVDLESNPAVKAVVFKLLDQVRGTDQFVEIVRDFKIPGQEPGLLQIAAQSPSGPAGVESMTLLLNGGDLSELKRGLAGTNELRLIEALGNTARKETIPLLEPIVTNQSKGFLVRREALKSLVKTPEGAARVIGLARSQTLPDDLKALASLELKSVRWEEVKTEAARILPPPLNPTAKPLPSISELVRTRGDPVNGASLFRSEKVGCSKCHQVNGQGVDFGPNLSEIGTKLAKEAIYEAILDPSAGISFGYEAWQMELKNGDEAYGLIVSETGDELTLKAVGGVTTTYPKTEITKRTRQKLSIMPAGLEQGMSPGDLVDLVEYLASLKKAAR